MLCFYGQSKEKTVNVNVLQLWESRLPPAINDAIANSDIEMAHLTLKVKKKPVTNMHCFQYRRSPHKANTYTSRHYCCPTSYSLEAYVEYMAPLSY